MRKILSICFSMLNYILLGVYILDKRLTIKSRAFLTV